MKIGFFTDGYLPQLNGVATTTEELRKSLLKIGNEVIVVAPKYPDYKDKDKNVLRLRSVVIHKNFNLRIAYMLPDKALRQVFKQKFDIIHGFSGGSTPILGLILAKIKKIPYVFTYNTRWNQYVHYLFGGKIISSKTAEKIMRIFCNRCNVVVAPTNYIKQELLSFGVTKPIMVIPNGVNINKFASGDKTFLRKKLKLNESDKIILYLGRLAKEKSVDFIIKSFTKIYVKYENVYLVIAGDGPSKKELIELSKELGIEKRVIFLGKIEFDQVQNIYSGADIFTSASQTETQGMYVYEALAGGLPVVSVSDQAFHQVIDNGVNGYSVEKNEDKFAEKTLELLENEDLRKKFSQNAFKKAEQFSLDEIAKKFVTLYKSLI